METTLMGLYIGFRVKGDLVSRFIMGIMKVTLWVMGVIDLLTKFFLTLQERCRSWDVRVLRILF